MKSRFIMIPLMTLSVLAMMGCNIDLAQVLGLSATNPLSAVSTGSVATDIEKASVTSTKPNCQQGNNPHCGGGVHIDG